MLDADMKPMAMTLRQLASKYKVSSRTLTRWIEKHRDYIGERVGYTYTPEQVRKIFERIGQP